MSNAAKKTIRMDRSKYFSTIHGERTPSDEYRQAHFAQDGLYFNAAGHLILELVPEDKKAAVEARLRKINKDAPAQAAPAVAQKTSEIADDDDAGDDDEDVVSDDGPSEEVNLEAWLRGEQQVQWFKVAAAIRDRYKKQVNNSADAVVFLVEEGVVPADQVGDKLKKHLG